MALSTCTQGWDPIPTCVYGTCNNSVCVCWEGYIHDHVVGRYDNCAMSLLGLYIYGGLTFAFLLASTFYSAYIAWFHSDRQTISREIALTAAATTTSMSLFFVILYSYGPTYVTPWFAAIIVCFGIFFFARLAGLIVVASIRPIAKFSRRAIENARKYEIFLTRVHPLMLGFAMLVCISVGHAIGDDDAISTAVGVAYVCVALAAFGDLPFLWHFMGLLIASLNNLLELDQARHLQVENKESDSSLSMTTTEDTKSNGRNGSITSLFMKQGKVGTADLDERRKAVAEIVRFRDRLAILRMTACSLALGMFIAGTIIGVGQLVARTIPFSYAFFFTILTVLAFLCAFIASHSKKREKRTAHAGQLAAIAFRPGANNNRVNDRTSTGNNSQDENSIRPEFSFSEGPKLRTIAEVSENSRWSQI